MIKKQEFFEELSKQLDFDIEDYVEIKDIEDYDQLYEDLLHSGAFDQEVIYYCNAIEYLKDNDNSLHISMELAEDYGYKLSDINSELLASLYKTQKCKEDFAELRSEIEFFLDDLK